MAFNIETIADESIRAEFQARRDASRGVCYCNQLHNSPCDFCSGLREPSWDDWKSAAKAKSSEDLLDDILAIWLISNSESDCSEDQGETHGIWLGATVAVLRQRIGVPA